MKMVVDESVDRPIVERLRQANHAVLYVPELSPSISDDEVLKVANDNQALLFTEDKDFGELVYRQNQVHRGVVLIRLAGLSPTLKAEIVSQAVQIHAQEMDGAFCVISPGAIRIRKPILEPPTS